MYIYIYVYIHMNIYIYIIRISFQVNRGNFSMSSTGNGVVLFTNTKNMEIDLTRHRQNSMPFLEDLPQKGLVRVRKLNLQMVKYKYKWSIYMHGALCIYIYMINQTYDMYIYIHIIYIYMSQMRKYCVTITILYTRYTIIVNLEFKQHVFSAKCLSSPWINAARAVLATRAQPVCRDAMIYAFEAGLMLVNYERKCQLVPQQVGSTYCARIHLLSLARSSWTEFVKGREHTLFEIKKQHVSAISRKEGKYGPVSKKAKQLEIAFALSMGWCDEWQLIWMDIPA